MYLIYYSTHAVPNLLLTPRQGGCGCGGGGADCGCLYYSTHVVPNLMQTRRLLLWRRRRFAAGESGRQRASACMGCAAVARCCAHHEELEGVVLRDALRALLGGDETPHGGVPSSPRSSEHGGSTCVAALLQARAEARSLCSFRTTVRGKQRLISQRSGRERGLAAHARMTSFHQAQLAAVSRVLSECHALRRLFASFVSALCARVKRQHCCA